MSSSTAAIDKEVIQVIGRREMTARLTQIHSTSKVPDSEKAKLHVQIQGMIDNGTFDAEYDASKLASKYLFPVSV
jgi:hypothetical protein